MINSNSLGLNEIRQAYLDFFTSLPRDHAEIPPAPIIPVNDATTLFTPFGMQQLVPYLKGEKHPQGTRVVDSQPSIRIDDIDEVGDNRHTTFFEMLGNWSLGDYFKREQLPWIFEFLTQVVGLNPSHLYVTVFEGNDIVPRDEESITIWQDLFHSQNPAKPGKEGFDPHTKIYLYDAHKNWWSRAGTPDQMPVGEIGGPDSEVFYDFDPGETTQIHRQSAYKDLNCHLNCDCGRFLEIGNSVFMEYIKKPDNSFKPLPAQNVDFGGGLERIAAAANNNPDVFTTDAFAPLITQLTTDSGKDYKGKHQPSMRIIADHLRAATFMIAGGVEPANKMQGYILRRLLRRSVLKAKQLGIPNIPASFSHLTSFITRYYPEPFLPSIDQKHLDSLIATETTKFEKTLNRGLKELDKYPHITGKIAFDLLQTYGFPWELTLEIAKDRGQNIDRAEFETEFKSHQDRSRSATKGMFKGGLADHSDAILQFHTTTHLLHQALRQVLGDHVQQMGSNITGERLRFDFKHPEKLTDDQKTQIESIINHKIAENLPVHKTLEPKDQALQSGALAFFRETYPDTVSVYTIGHDPQQNWFSKELCGGPHVSSTGQISPVTIKKEESVGAGIRRIYIQFR